MKTCILKNHSSVNGVLYRRTLGNHAEYADRHGYDLISINMSGADAVWGTVDMARRQLTHYDVVVTVGSDVLFTRMETPISYFTDKYPEAGAIISLEDIGGSQTNADLIIWLSQEGRWAANDVDIHHRQFADHPWGPQAVFNHFLQDNDPAHPAVAFAPWRELQSTPVLGFPRSMWQPGDFALHFLGMSNETKFEGCDHFLRTGEVIWRT